MRPSLETNILYCFYRIKSFFVYLSEKVSKRDLPAHVKWYRERYLLEPGRFYFAETNAERRLCLPLSAKIPIGFGIEKDEFRDKAVLDIGCGIFPTLSPLKGTAIRMGVDKDTAVYVKAFRDMARFLGCPYPRIQAVAEMLPVKDESVDVIICLDGLRYFEPKRTLSEFNRILKNNGKIFLSVFFNHSLADHDPSSFLYFLDSYGFRMTECNNFIHEGVKCLKCAALKERSFPSS